jgi:hypothetical protein
MWYQEYAIRRVNGASAQSMATNTTGPLMHDALGITSARGLIKFPT